MILLNDGRKVFEIPKTNIEKLELIRKWYNWFYKVEEDWDNGLGSEIAYLLGAIMNDTCIEVEADSPMLHVLNKHAVSKTESIWKYLYFSNN